VGEDKLLIGYIMIKYCIWDVGNTTYKFTLDVLHQWCIQNSIDKELTKEKLGKFSFNSYMLGNCSFVNMCKDLCDFYMVEYFSGIEAQIDVLLHQGVGEYIQETAEVRRMMKDAGVINGILSNALPCLSDTLVGDDFDKRFYFTSYQMHLLKPDVRIFETLLKELQCQANEVIFVDDKKKNVDAASGIGMYGVQYVPGLFHVYMENYL